MEGMQLKSERIVQWIKKYKYAILVLALGVALLLWPTGTEKQAPAPEPEAAEPADSSEQTQLQSFQQELEQVLEKVEGAGQVRVLLTLKTGPQYIYQKDHSRNDSTDADGAQTKLEETTVIVSAGSSVQQAILSQTIYPKYQGAVVLSQGADNAAVKLNLVNAVASLTGLSTDKITVIKMKEN